MGNELTGMLGQLITSKLNQVTTTLTGAGALAASVGGAIGSAVNIRKARDEENRIYGYSKDILNAQYYRDPLSTTGNRALLKSMDERMKDSAEALQNRAVASGATVENQLAAKQADNRVMSNLYTSLLQGEDARRDRISQQRLGLEQQHSANLQNNFYQNAQNWQAWGSAMGNAITQLGTAQIQENEQNGQLIASLIGLA